MECDVNLEMDIPDGSKNQFPCSGLEKKYREGTVLRKHKVLHGVSHHHCLPYCLKFSLG